jgi:glycerophosphoryl diester phosphodiesterase
MRSFISPLFLLISINAMNQNTTIDIQGHRGARGLLPENTIPAFIKAVELGVHTVELDVVITKDKQVLVSHEPYMSAQICSNPDGSEIKNEKQLNIYEMTYEEVKQFDCGSKFHPKFAEQQKIKVHKPLLSEAIDAIEAYIARNNLPKVAYNIEIKSTESGSGIYHPQPEEFAQLVVDLVKKKEISDRTIIQSFDVRSIQAVRKIAPEIKISLLVANIKGVDKNIDLLGFTPEYYSPHFKLINKKAVKKLHEKNIKIAVWTVNEVLDIQKMIDLGVDAIITDYPDRALKVLQIK